MVRKSRGRSRVLVEVGASFTDLFGFDRAVWVEGPTEEACFPRILKRLLGRVPLGQVFLVVKNTGDFEKKGNQKKLIWDIYNRLSSGISLLPSTVNFSFDREYRTEQEIADLKRQSRGRVHFLPRLSYENYLLHADAIAAVLNAVPRDSQPNVDVESVQAWLKSNGSKYIKNFDWSGDVSDTEWLKKAHAPKLLEDLFDELSGVNMVYQKTVHSIALTDWLLDNRPSSLTELANYIQELTPQPQSSGVSA